MSEIQEWNPDWLKTKGNYVTLITPEIAEGLLKTNVRNRSPRSRKVAQFGRDMKNGRWDPDASDVKFDVNENLMDGQQRFMACVEVKVAFPTLVRTGLNTEARNKVDTGTARTNADMLKMNGVSGPLTGIAAAVNLRIRYDYRVEVFDRKRGWDFKTPVLTHDEMLDYLNEHEMVVQFASLADGLRKSVTPGIPTSAWLAFLSWAAEIDPTEAWNFGERMRMGEFGGQGDPLQALLAYAALARTRPGGSPGARGRVAQEEHLLALIKAWNAHRQGKPIARLVIGRQERLEVPV